MLFCFVFLMGFFTFVILEFCLKSKLLISSGNRATTREKTENILEPRCGETLQQGIDGIPCESKKIERNWSGNWKIHFTESELFGVEFTAQGNTSTNCFWEFHFFEIWLKFTSWERITEARLRWTGFLGHAGELQQQWWRLRVKSVQRDTRHHVQCFLRKKSGHETSKGSCGQRARRAFRTRHVRVLGRGIRVFKDSVRLIAYDKPINYFNFINGATRILRTTIRMNFGHLQVMRILKTSFLRHLCVFCRISDQPSAKSV